MARGRSLNLIQAVINPEGDPAGCGDVGSDVCADQVTYRISATESTRQDVVEIPTTVYPLTMIKNIEILIAIEVPGTFTGEC